MIVLGILLLLSVFVNVLFAATSALMAKKSQDLEEAVDYYAQLATDIQEELKNTQAALADRELDLVACAKEYFDYGPL